MSWVTRGALRPHLGHGLETRPSACQALAVAGSAGSRGPSPVKSYGLVSCRVSGSVFVAVSVAVKEPMRGTEGPRLVVRRPSLSTTPGARRRLGSELQRDVGRERGECGRVDRAA